MVKLVLLRHGESVWNREKRFTGWADVDLSPRGEQQAHTAGSLLQAKGFGFDLCFSSRLKRACETLRIALGAMKLDGLPVTESWRLNERHYGRLQGLIWWQALLKHGPRATLACQLSATATPPPLHADDASCPDRDPSYADLHDEQLPRAESLQATAARLLPYWEETILPAIGDGKRVLLVAHNNTLGALVQHLDRQRGAAESRLRLPTARPLVYELDHAARPLRRYYLESEPAMPRWRAASTGS